MLEALLRKLTLLGDPVLLLLCALAVFFYLWSGDERRNLARSWAISFGVCVLITVASKFAFHLIRWNEENALRLLSPSGHVAIGTVFYGCCTMMLSSQYRHAVRVSLWAATALLIGMIAASRVVLGLHSVPEILVAFLIGATSIGIFTRQQENARPVQINSGQITALLVLVAVAYSMPRISGEALILHVVRKLV